MPFNSLSFYLFVFSVYLFSKIFKLKKVNAAFLLTLIGTPLYFIYAKKHFIILLALVGLACVLVSWIYKKKSKLALISSLLMALIPFLFFRYSLVSNAFIELIPFVSTLKRPAIFLGMAFLFLRIVSLFTDTLEDEEKPSIKEIFCYLLYFPSFISGPLERMEDFREKLNTEYDYNLEDLFEGVYRIIKGSFKKVVIGNTLLNLSVSNLSMENLSQVPSLYLVLSLYLYTLTIYFDFSGYSDIAIGIGRIFGVKIPENFGAPFKARNIQEFWNNWHISFMHWLRDYLYYPFYRLLHKLKIRATSLLMGGSFLITFTIAGLWHGDSLKYLYTGLYYGVCFAFWVAYKSLLEEKLGKKEVKNKYLKSNAIRYLAIFITLNIYTFSLIFYVEAYALVEELWNRI